jgi:hypothetical protein
MLLKIYQLLYMNLFKKFKKLKKKIILDYLFKNYNKLYDLFEINSIIIS